MVGLGWLELGGTGGAGDVGRSASVGGNGSKGSGGFIRLGGRDHGRDGRAGRPGTHHRMAVQTTIDRDELSLRQAFAFMARSPSAVQHGWFRTRHDKNVDRLECRAPAAVDCEPAARESRGLVRSLLTSSRAGSAGCGACPRFAAGRAAYLAWLHCWPRRLYGHPGANLPCVTLWQRYWRPRCRAQKARWLREHFVGLCRW